MEPQPNPTDAKPVMLTVALVAEILAITPTAVRHLIQGGDLRAVDVAPRTSSRAQWRIDKRWVVEFLAKRTAAVTDPEEVPLQPLVEAEAEESELSRLRKRLAVPDYLHGARFR